MVDWIYKIFYANSFKHIILLMFFSVVIWMFFSQYIAIDIYKKKIWKGCNIILCVGVFCLILLVTIFSRSVGETTVQWIPLHSFIDAKMQPEIYRSMFMNVFLFFPLGLTMPFALSEKCKKKIIITVFCALGMSTIIEITQYSYRIGCAEIDDVICNVMGCFVGTLAYGLQRK